MNNSTSLSPPFCSPATFTTTPSSSLSTFPQNSLRFSCSQSFGPKAINPFCRKARFCSLQGSTSVKSRKSLVLCAINMTIATDSLLQVVEEEEGPPDFALLDPEDNSRPRRIALFVEPSPFAWVGLLVFNSSMCTVCGFQFSLNVECFGILKPLLPI